MTFSGIARIVGGVAAAGLVLGYLSCVHVTNQHQMGLRYDLLTGEASADRAGVYVTAPWVQVTRIELRPQRVCISSVAKVLVCKLVQFQPTEYAEFLKREGFRYYWWDNRLSFNMGYGEEYRGLRDIFRGYAFDMTSHPFLVEVNP